MNNKYLKNKIYNLESRIDKLSDMNILTKDIRDQLNVRLERNELNSKKIISFFFKKKLNSFDNYISKLKLQAKIANEDLIAYKKIFEEKTKGLPWLSKAISDFEAMKTEKLAIVLESKRHPAYKAAEVIREVKEKRKIIENKYKYYKYLIDYYETIFPDLIKLRDDEITKNVEGFFSADTSIDPVKNWLTREEYNTLPNNIKFQRALDNYWKKKKSNWVIGRDYERYIGYYYETMGYSVNYVGIFKGLEDLGRDLICKKDGETLVIQCKYWSKKKQIHEKHINQLFGTTVEYMIKNTNMDFEQLNLFPELFKTNKIKPVFITSTSLSNTARKFANILKVEIHEKLPFDIYPCIKCNISKDTGEKIYHLPFDQQYDNTIIETDDGEFYALTIDEAESKGYRRAYRWLGN